MKTLAIVCAGFLGGCQSLWGTLSVPNPDNCVSTPSLCLGDEICDLQEQICHPALSLYAVTPNLVPTRGGGTVKLLGERFLPGIQVDWQGITIADVNLISSTEMTFSLPTSQQGAWWTPIALRNPTLHSVRRDDLFSYYSESLGFSASSLSGQQNPRRMAVGDWNSDGRRDVAYTSTSDTAVVLSLGNGDGTLGSSRFTSIGSALQRPHDLLAIDADGDSKLDLIVAVADGVQTLLGDGKGGFATGPAMKTGARPALLALLRQGPSDQRTLVVADGGDKTISVLSLQKDGTYGTPQVIATAILASEMWTGDSTGDGFDEIFAVDNLAVRVLQRDGLGGYSNDMVATPGCAVQGISLADLNLDGRLDVAVACTKGLLTLRNQAGTLVPEPLLIPTRSPSAHLLAADLSGDGWPELIFGDTVGKTTFALLSDRQGGYLVPTQISTEDPGSTQNSSIYAIADFDGDHKTDLAIGSPEAGNSAKLVLLTNRSP